jgi:hypothetical protein
MPPTLSLKNRKFLKLEKIPEKQENKEVALNFICIMRVKDYFVIL